MAQTGPGRGSPGDPCASSSETARGVIRFSVAGNVLDRGVFEVKMAPSRDFVINVSEFRGGGMVTVPRKWVDVAFVVEQREISSKSKPKLDIVAMKATVKSLRYPLRVISGLNLFQIVPEKSSISLGGTKGTVAVNGKAEARLVNTIFSSRKPATVKATFEGSYDLEKHSGILTRMDLRATSPVTR